MAHSVGISIKPRDLVLFSEMRGKWHFETWLVLFPPAPEEEGTPLPAASKLSFFLFSGCC